MPSDPRFQASAIRRLFLAGLGVVYVIAFVSLWMQIDGLVGPQGILPAGEFLAAAGEQLGGGAPWRLPTLAWLSGTSGGALEILCAAGAAAGLLLAAGVGAPLSALVAWALYLSLVHVGQDFLSFQWDILLLEAGFLAVFYAPLAWTPWSRGWRAEPPRVVTWVLRLLIAKLMFLSGVVKLSSGDPTWRDLTALSYHYQTTCLPTWSGWWMNTMPLWFHRLSALAMFVVELALPFAAFGPRPLRLVAAAAFVGLMVFIGATGNYGFFNLLTVVLCLPLLDDAVVPRRLRARLGVEPHIDTNGARLSPWNLLCGAVAAFVLVLTPVPVSMAAHRASALPAPLLRLFEWQVPFHLVNGYGLFAHMTTKRPEIVIEGSRDGVDWRAYEFRWKPGDLSRRPQFVEPYMPRLDWQMWFAALGSYRSSPWFLGLCRRLLEGSAPVLSLFATDPFAGSPPQYLRATVYDYRFTTDEERRRSGNWWERTEVGRYIPPLTLDRTSGRLRPVETPR